MDEHIPIAAVRLDEPVSLGRVEPFDGTLGHRLSPALDVKKTRPRFRVPRHKRASGSPAQFPSRETHSRTAKSDCGWIATRNPFISKPLARLRKFGQWPSRRAGMAARGAVAAPG